MTLDAGDRLGPYEIQAPAGRGGMGEVYRATDTRLDRTVAIKVLPSHLSENADAKARFEREAKTISTLNHPNICVLYDVGHQEGVDFLVMEYLEGETLAERLEKKGALPVDEALGLASKIADALDRAHGKGIVHRDLKPANIMLTASGPKLVDFGLAKQVLAQVATGDSELATEQKDLTQERAILGTLQYMAPEQLEGEPADARTDLFAFGAVLHEMLTGKKVFEGKSQASLIAAILERTPEAVSAIRPVSPRALDRVVMRCLAKSPAERWESARDVKEVLGWVAEDARSGSGATAGARTPRASSPRAWLPWAVTALLSAALLVSYFSRERAEPPEPKPTGRFVIRPGEDAVATRSGTGERDIAISPDGTLIAYADRGQIFLRPLDQTAATPVSDAGLRATGPFFSPDGEWLGFIDETDGALKRVSVRGGASMTLVRNVVNLEWAAWGPDDTIIYDSRNSGETGLLRIPAAGGESTELTALVDDDFRHFEPVFLPGGDGVLFTIVRRPSNVPEPSVAHLSLSSGRITPLISRGYHPQYVPTGHLIYVSESSLRAVRFDPDEVTILGSPFPVVEGVRADYAVSKNGVLVYLPSLTDRRELLLSWVDRKGSATPLDLPGVDVGSLSLSPGGDQIALEMTDESGTNIWVYDLERGTLGKRTFGGNNTLPIWSPDGDEIIFAADAFRAVKRVRADGSSTPEEVPLELPGGGLLVPTSWSATHRTLLFRFADETWRLSLDEEGAAPFLSHPNAIVQEARFSPDENWVAYRSSETGRDEIYVVPFPGPGGKHQISNDGGAQPMWSPTGRELFYKSGDRMMAVDVETGPSFTAGLPRVLFESTLPERVPGDPSRYAVSPDGERFLVITPAPGAEDSAGMEIHVVMNWFEELERLSPPEEE